jgi:hypothetical protein
MRALQADDEGRPAGDPPTLSAAVPKWSAGDVIALGRGRALRVVEMRDVRPGLAARTCSGGTKERGLAQSLELGRVDRAGSLGKAAPCPARGVSWRLAPVRALAGTANRSCRLDLRGRFRRRPELTLLVHAMCLYVGLPNKPNAAARVGSWRTVTERGTSAVVLISRSFDVGRVVGSVLTSPSREE